MIKFENTEVMGWEAAIRGMRNPMNSWLMSDSEWNDYDELSFIPDHIPVMINEDNDEAFYLGPNDLDLMERLRNAGTDHRKFMRMITVYVDITAPLYWWKEFDTYKSVLWRILARRCIRSRRKSLRWRISLMNIFASDSLWIFSRRLLTF